uniref:MFS transporter n=1 Tax=Herbidospora sakaeratensis TaxID=564415 RepID=UPI000784ECDC|nr:MFS transporter [Herbidospora sakaeratensis]
MHFNIGRLAMWCGGLTQTSFCLLELSVPLVALMNGHSPLTMGLLLSVSMISRLVATFPAGLYIEKLSPFSVLNWSNGIQAIVIVLLMWAGDAGNLNMTSLIVYSVSSGFIGAFTSTAGTRMLSSIRSRRSEGSGADRYEMIIQGANVAGRLVGVCLMVLDPAAGLAAGTIMSVAALLIGAEAAKYQSPVYSPARRSLPDAVDGLRHIGADSFLTTALWVVLMTTMTAQALTIDLLSTLAGDPMVTGLIVAMAPFGGLVGARLARYRKRFGWRLERLTSRGRWPRQRQVQWALASGFALVGPNRSILIVQAWVWVVVLLLPVENTWRLGFGLFTMGFIGTIANVSIMTVIEHRVEEGKRGPVHAAIRLAAVAGLILGPTIGGFLAAQTGETGTSSSLAVAMLAATVTGTVAHLWRGRKRHVCVPTAGPSPF